MVAEIEVISGPGPATIGNIEVALCYVVVPQFVDRHQALEARVHIAVKCVVLEAHDPIFVIRWALVWPGPTRGLGQRGRLGRRNCLSHLIRSKALLQYDGRPTPIQRNEEVKQVLANAIVLGPFLGLLNNLLLTPRS